MNARLFVFAAFLTAAMAIAAPAARAVAYQGQGADDLGSVTAGINGSWGLPFSNGTAHRELSLRFAPGAIIYDSALLTSGGVNFDVTQTFGKIFNNLTVDGIPNLKAGLNNYVYDLTTLLTLAPLTPTADIPEPAGLLGFASALLILTVRRRRR